MVTPSGMDPNLPHEHPASTPIERGSSLGRHTVQAHPEKSSIFKGVIKTITRVASSILLVPLIVGGAALAISKVLNRPNDDIGKPYGKTASKIRAFAARYLLLAPLGKALLGDKAEHIAAIKAKFEAAFSERRTPDQTSNIQKAFNLLKNALFFENSKDLPEALILLMNNGAVALIEQILPNLVDAELINKDLSGKLQTVVRETGYFISECSNVLRIHAAFGSKDRPFNLLFDYFEKHPVTEVEYGRSQYVKRAEDDIKKNITDEEEKQILIPLVNLAKDDPTRELQLKYFKYDLNPTHVNKAAFEGELKKFEPSQIPAFIKEKYPQICKKHLDIKTLVDSSFTSFPQPLSETYLLLKNIFFDLLHSDEKNEKESLLHKFKDIICKKDYAIASIQELLKSFRGLCRSPEEAPPAGTSRLKFFENPELEPTKSKSPPPPTSTPSKSILKPPRSSNGSQVRPIFITTDVEQTLVKFNSLLQLRQDLAQNGQSLKDRLRVQKEKMKNWISNLNQDDKSRIDKIFSFLESIISSGSLENNSRQVEEINHILQNSPRLLALKGNQSLGEFLALGSQEDIDLINTLIIT
jgi:hypothetical protein